MSKSERVWMCTMAFGLVVALGACGVADEEPQPTPAPQPAPSPPPSEQPPPTAPPTAPPSEQPPSQPPAATSVTISLTPSGVTPASVTVVPGARVTFANNDAVPHEIASMPHPVHTDCPELNVGLILPGASATAVMANRSGTCRFHDHLDPFNTAFQGAIVVTSMAPPATGGISSGGGY